MPRRELTRAEAAQRIKERLGELELSDLVEVAQAKATLIKQEDVRGAEQELDNERHREALLTQGIEERWPTYLAKGGTVDDEVIALLREAGLEHLLDNPSVPRRVTVTAPPTAAPVATASLNAPVGGDASSLAADSSDRQMTADDVADNALTQTSLQTSVVGVAARTTVDLNRTSAGQSGNNLDAGAGSPADKLATVVAPADSPEPPTASSEVFGTSVAAQQVQDMAISATNDEAANDQAIEQQQAAGVAHLPTYAAASAEPNAAAITAAEGNASLTASGDDEPITASADDELLPLWRTSVATGGESLNASDVDSAGSDAAKPNGVPTIDLANTPASPISPANYDASTQSCYPPPPRYLPLAASSADSTSITPPGDSESVRESSPAATPSVVAAYVGGAVNLAGMVAQPIAEATAEGESLPPTESSPSPPTTPPFAAAETVSSLTTSPTTSARGNDIVDISPHILELLAQTEAALKGDDLA